jgi:hypothetical protein
MLWDPFRKPLLRPLDAFRTHNSDGASVGVRDRSGLSDVVLGLSAPALQIMSLMDGTNTCQDIRRKFSELHGQALSADTLQSMLEQLERAHFLEGPGFDAYYEACLDEYRKAGARKMRDPTALGLVDDSTNLFTEMLDGAGTTTVPGPVVGLIAPHLDYSRGKPCYAAAYASLRDRAAPGCVVILGTNHFGRATSVVATASDFVTPLGTTRTDVHFLSRMEAQLGNLRSCELDHLREHSIELQVVWLQHLFGAESFQMVAFLCPDPCRPTGTGPDDTDGVDLCRFASALGDLIEQDDRDVLLVAGADLSHLGAAFGDERELEDAFLEEARRRDQNALEYLRVNDPAGFVRAVAENDNPTRICSAGCIFVLATALPNATGTVLRYHQALDPRSQTCVTCAAVAFT